MQRPRLGEILVGLEILTRSALEKAVARHAKTGGRFGDSLVRMKVLTKEDLGRARSAPRALRKATLSGTLPSIVLRKIPASIAGRLQVVPLAFVDKARALAIASAFPQDQELQARMREIVGMPVLFCGATPEVLRETVLRLYNADQHSAAASADGAPQESAVDSGQATAVRPPSHGAAVYADLFEISEVPPRIDVADDNGVDIPIDVDATGLDEDQDPSTKDDPFQADAAGAVVRRVGEILISDGLVDPLGLQRAMDQRRHWGGRLCTALVDLGLISAEELANVLSKEVGAPVIRLLEYAPEPAALQLLSPAICRKLRLFPLAVGPDPQGVEILVVAMVDPTDAAAIDEVQAAAGRPVRIVLAREDEIEGAVRLHYGAAGPEILTTRSSIDPFAPASRPASAASPAIVDPDPLPSLGELVAGLDKIFPEPAEASERDGDDPIGSGLLTPIDEQARSNPDPGQPVSLNPAEPTVRRKLQAPR